MFAATATSVKIGGAELNAANPYYHNGVNGAPGTANNTEAGANAEFNAKTETLTLTLENLALQGNIVADCDLNIVLEGNNTINSDIYNAIKVDGDLKISGNGSLTASNGNSSQTTVYAAKAMTIKDGAKVSATKVGGEAQAIHASSITISGTNTVVTAINNGTASDEGLASYALKASSVTVFDGASLTAIQGGSEKVPAVYGTVNISEGSTVNVGTSAQDASTLNSSTTKLERPPYKYVMISAAGGEQVHVHNMAKTEAKTATCTEIGNNAYYTCETCHNVFKDEAGTQPTTVEAETISATGHKIAKKEAKDATCTETGNNAYYTCETCHKVFKDEAGTQPTTVEAETIPAGHSFEGDFISMGTEGHTQKCKICGVYDEVKPHEFNGNICTACGYTKQSSGGHYKPTQKPEIIAGEGSQGDLTLNGTKVTITVEEGYELVDVLVNGISKGKVTELTGLKTGDKVEIKTEKIPEKLEPQAVKDLVKELKLVARSERLSNGNVRIKVTKITDINDNPVDLNELEKNGYTVKFKYYRSVKKSAGYDTRLEKDADINSYINNFGDKGTKYYYKVKVMVYDADGNLVAQSSLNQCKYAMRTWIK